ncbi:MAG: DUF5615 family PIN-like protein [Anaerolineales bacterium]|nr:DUF5615 family PIN-like protein [Anaerolineales bacterium]
MKFKVDENLPIEAAEALRQAGHEASTIGEQGLSGGSDSAVAQVCQQEGRALMTLDLDFADIRAYPPQDYPGLVVLRLRRQDKPYVLQIMARVIQMLNEATLEKKLWIVEDDFVRIRE